MTKPHFSTISSSNSHAMQESMTKLQKHSGLQILLAGVRQNHAAGLTQRKAGSRRPTGSHHPVTHPHVSAPPHHKKT